MRLSYAFSVILTPLLLLPAPSFARVDACSDLEQKALPLKYRQTKWFQAFEDGVRGKASGFQSLSEAIQFESLSRWKRDEFEKEFAGYWIARTLDSLGFESLAKQALLPLVQHGQNRELRKLAEKCLEHLEIKPQDLSNENRLLRGRTLYSTARFEDAIREFQSVDKKSNLAIEALQNLSWAYLMGGHYEDAIGVGLQLTSGPLRSTFAPEGPLVAAMALNEVCQFPEAIRMIARIRQDYDAVMLWLKDAAHLENGYREILAALKRQSRAPVKLQTEWIRSPEFLLRQAKINALLEEPSKLQKISQGAHAERKKKIRELNRKTTEFLNEYSRRRDPNRYRELRRQFRDLRNWERAEKIWAKIRTRRAREIPVETRKIAQAVDGHFKRSQLRLKKQLTAVYRNAELVEIEILNGASQDLVWREAHPEFLSKIKQLRVEKPEPDSSSIWKWGRILLKDRETAELWEDELGALKAEVGRHCDLKEKYLRITLGSKP